MRFVFGLACVLALQGVAYGQQSVLPERGAVRVIEAKSATIDGDFDFPRKSTNQLRVSILCEECGPLDPDWGDGSGGGYSGTCVKNHKCSGGAICATGSCTPSTGRGCAYCSAGEKCKDVTCS